MGLEDLEVDQRVDLWRTRTRGFNQLPSTTQLRQTILDHLRPIETI